MSEADVAKLQQADEIIAEATAIVPCCNNDSAYSLLDTIEQNAEKFSGIAETIRAIRAEYRTLTGDLILHLI